MHREEPPAQLSPLLRGPASLSAFLGPDMHMKRGWGLSQAWGSFGKGPVMSSFCAECLLRGGNSADCSQNPESLGRPEQGREGGRSLSGQRVEQV